MTANKKRRRLPEEDLAAAVSDIINSPITRSNLSFLRSPEKATPLGSDTTPPPLDLSPLAFDSTPIELGDSSKSLWQAEGLLALFEQTRVRPILGARDALSAVEARVYDLLWGAVPDPTGLEFQLVHCSLQRIATEARINLKTVRQLIPRLIDKGFIRIERQADVRRNIATLYRVFSESSVLSEQERLQRRHVVRTGKGVFYVHPVSATVRPRPSGD
jgi:predicted transcriptional regulator